MYRKIRRNSGSFSQDILITGAVVRSNISSYIDHEGQGKGEAEFAGEITGPHGEIRPQIGEDIRPVAFPGTGPESVRRSRPAQEFTTCEGSRGTEPVRRISDHGGRIREVSETRSGWRLPCWRTAYCPGPPPCRGSGSRCLVPAKWFPPPEPCAVSSVPGGPPFDYRASVPRPLPCPPGRILRPRSLSLAVLCPSPLPPS